MRKKTGYLKAIGILMFLLFIPALGFPEEAGRLSKVAGRVDILRSGADNAVSVKEGESVSVGDIIRTKSDGRAEVTFVDNSVMKIGPRSRLGIEEYLYKPDKETRNVSLRLYRGIAGFHVRKALYPAGGSKFEMKTRTAVAGVRGTEGILYTSAYEAVYIKEGLVKYSSPRGTVMVGAGMTGEVLDGKTPIERPMLREEYERLEGKLSPRLDAGISEVHRAVNGTVVENDGRFKSRPSAQDAGTEDRTGRHITGPEEVRYEPISQETEERVSAPVKVNERLDNHVHETHPEEIISQPPQVLPVTDVDGTSKVDVDVKFK